MTHVPHIQATASPVTLSNGRPCSLWHVEAWTTDEDPNITRTYTFAADSERGAAFRGIDTLREELENAASMN